MDLPQVWNQEQNIFFNDPSMTKVTLYQIPWRRDSKSFSSIKDIYDGATVEKLECMGHYQKNLDSMPKAEKMLRDLVIEVD